MSLLLQVIQITPYSVYGSVFVAAMLFALYLWLERSKQLREFSILFNYNVFPKFIAAYSNDENVQLN